MSRMACSVQQRMIRGAFAGHRYPAALDLLPLSR